MSIQQMKNQVQVQVPAEAQANRQAGFNRIANLFYTMGSLVALGAGGTEVVRNWKEISGILGFHYVRKQVLNQETARTMIDGFLKDSPANSMQSKIFHKLLKEGTETFCKNSPLYCSPSNSDKYSLLQSSLKQMVTDKVSEAFCATVDCIGGSKTCEIYPDISPNCTKNETQEEFNYLPVAIGMIALGILFVGAVLLCGRNRNIAPVSVDTLDPSITTSQTPKPQTYFLEQTNKYVEEGHECIPEWLSEINIGDIVNQYEVLDIETSESEEVNCHRIWGQQLTFVSEGIKYKVTLQDLQE